MAKYLIRKYSEYEKKYCYLTTKKDKDIERLFNCCYIFGERKNAKIFKNKHNAYIVLRNMRNNRTGNNAEIYQVKERSTKNGTRKRI